MVAVEKVVAVGTMKVEEEEMHLEGIVGGGDRSGGGFREGFSVKSEWYFSRDFKQESIIVDLLACSSRYICAN